MLPDHLKDKYEVTKRVTAAKFRNATLGLVDIGNISEALAKKLVKTGHLKFIGKPEPKAEGSPSAEKKK